MLHQELFGTVWHVQMMNVDGLTRENVASHLQKYRLQLSKQKPNKEDQRDGATAAETGQGPADGVWDE